MPKLQCNFPAIKDVLATDRVAGDDCLSATDDIIETAITQMQAEMRRVTIKTTTATLTSSEGGLVKVTAASSWTLGLPAASGDLTGLMYFIVKTDDNNNEITLDANASETINEELTYEGLHNQWDWVIIRLDGSNWIIIASSDVTHHVVTEVKEEGTGTMLRGTALYISGAVGANTLVGIADNTNSGKIRVVGLAYKAFTGNGTGHALINGVIHNIDTRKDIGGINDEAGVNWSAGDILYVNSNGLLTSARPTSGRVIKAGMSVQGSGVTDDILVHIRENPVDMAAAAGEGIRMRLGADNGSTKITIKNYSNTEVASIDDKGVGQFKTTVTIFSSVDTLAVTEAGQILVSAGSPYTLTLPTPVGYMGLTYKIKKTDFNYNLITVATAAGQFNYENADSALKSTYPRLNTGGAEATFVSDGTNWQVINEALGQVPRCWVSVANNQEGIPTSTLSVIDFDNEEYDVGNNFNAAVWVSGTADGDVESHLQDDGTTPFLSTMVGKRVKNTDAITYAYITDFNDTGDVTLSADIFPVGNEAYEIKYSRFIIPISGFYKISAMLTYRNTDLVADKIYYLNLYKNEGAIAAMSIQSAMTSEYLKVPLSGIMVSCDVDDYITCYAYQKSNADQVIWPGISSTRVFIELISKN